MKRLKGLLTLAAVVGGINTAAAQNGDSLDSLLGAAPNNPPAATAPAKPTPAAKESAVSGNSATDTGSKTAQPEPAAAAKNNQPAPVAATQKAATTATTPVKTENATRNPAEKNRLLEEIVVTAEKREEGVQTVPIAISAFSGKKLDALGVQTAQDLPRITPGLTFANNAGYPIVYLRGVGSDAFLPSADQDVPIYLDGVALLGGHGVATTLGRIKRVEVLKGPQGTLFGRNSTGGAISIITPDPGPQFGGDVQAEFGNYGTFNQLLFLNLPIVDGLAATISGYSDRNDSYTQNDAGATIGTYSRGGRIKLLWNATDNLSFNLSAIYGEESTNHGTTGENVRVSPYFSLIIPQDPKLDGHISEDVIGGSVQYSQLYAGGFDWNLPWTELKLILSDQKLNNTYEAYDYDGSVLPLISFDSTDEFFNQATAEFQILSTPDTPMAKYFSWVAGAYYLEGNGGFPNLILRVANGGSAANSGLLSILPGSAGLIGGLNNALTGAGLPEIAGLTGPINLDSGGLLSSRSLSGYFQGRIHLQDIFGLGDPVNLILGARLDRESRGLSDNRLSLINPLTPGFSTRGPEIPLLTFHVPKVSAVQVPLKAELQWFPTDLTQIYGSFSRGFTAPTYSSVNLFIAPPPLQPQKVNSYELGLKTQLFDQTLTLNTALFYIKEYELLTGFASLTSGGVVNFDNAPAARIYGAEVDFTWQALPEFDPGFVVEGSASYLNSKYTSYPDGRGYDPNTGLSFGPGLVNDPRNFTGNRIDHTPILSYNIGLNQSINLGDDSRIELGFETNFSGRYFYDAQNAPQYATSAFQIFDAQASYFYKPWGIQATAFVKNLTNEVHNASSFILDTGDFQTRNDPRTFGVRFKYTF